MNTLFWRRRYSQRALRNCLACKDLQSKIYAQKLHIFERKERFLDAVTTNLHKVYPHADCTWKLDLVPFIVVIWPGGSGVCYNQHWYLSLKSLLRPLGIYLCCCHGWGVCIRHFSHGQCWSSASSRLFYYKPVLCPDIGRSLLWLSKERVVFEHALLQEVKSVWSIMPDNARDRMSWSLRLDYKRNMRQDLTMQSHLCSLPHCCRFLFLCSLSIWLAQQRGTLLADRKCLWRPWSCQTSFCHFFLLSYVNCRDWSEIKMTFIWRFSYYLFYTSGPTVPCIIWDTGLVNNRRSKVRTSVGHTRICFPSDLSHWLKNIPLSFIYVLLAIRGSYYNSYNYNYYYYY